jgi:hypothetical protein
MKTVDLNCDLGESFGVWEMGNDAAMIDLATTVNIACGYHGGDADVMRTTVELAKARGLRPEIVRDREPRRLPDRRAAGDRDRGRSQGDPRQGAWRIVQRCL